MTARPTLVCPRCGSSDFNVSQVDTDGSAKVRCSNRMCSNAWEIPAPSPAAVPELRDLGARLAGQRRAIARTDRKHRQTHHTQTVRLAAARSAEELVAQIRDALEGAHGAPPPEVPSVPPSEPAA